MPENDDTTTTQQPGGDAAAAGTGTSGAAPGVDAPGPPAAGGGGADSPADQFDEAFNEKPELFVAGAFAAGLGIAVLLRALGGGSDD